LQHESKKSLIYKNYEVTYKCRMGNLTNGECRMMNEAARSKSSSFCQGAQICILLISILFVFTYPVSGEVDPNYKEQLTGLTAKFLTTGFSEEEIQRIFSDERVELYPQILERSAKGLPYFNRKFGLLTKKSIERGRKVLTDNQDVLVRVEKTYGVDKEIIIAILRVETNFNRYVGKYPIFNSLLTLAIIENRRSAWAEGELTELLRISKNLDKDPLSIRGSWAGAFGMAQFIPSSYTKYAVDGNNDGIVDLFDFSDATASIANYLKAHGWEKNNSEKNWKAVYAYNHCDEYVKAIFAYAKNLKAGPSQKKRT
jgi:membrane-bound lytic murein transglycosylase B